MMKIKVRQVIANHSNRHLRELLDYSPRFVNRFKGRKAKYQKIRKNKEKDNTSNSEINEEGSEEKVNSEFFSLRKLDQEVEAVMDPKKKKEGAPQCQSRLQLLKEGCTMLRLECTNITKKGKKGSHSTGDLA